MLALFLAFALGAMAAGLVSARHGLRRQRLRREMETVLADLGKGNLNRRLVIRENDEWAEVCFGINALAANYQAEQSKRRAMEASNQSLLTSLTHDVRTPLTSLRGYLEALDGADLTEEERRADWQTAQQKARDLQRYIEQLFQWFKLANGEARCQLAVADWAEVIRRIAASWIVRWEAGGWRYQLDMPPEPVWVRLDALACQRMVDNVLDNALTHSGGGQMTIRLQTQGEQAVLSLTDDGQGLTEAEMGQMFDRLFTGDAARAQGRGSGLGLAIVRELASAQGGRVWAESAPGKGLSVFIALPLAKE